MAGEAWPIDVSSGSPSYTAAEGRQLFSANLLNGTTDAFGVRAGRRPGAGMVVTCPTATTYQVTPGAYIAMPAFAALQGPYLCQFGSNQTGSVNAAHATLPRKDILYVRVDDAGAGDGSGARQAIIVYLAGTAASSPSAPAVPARGNLLATISVPASGGGSPTIAMGPMGVAAGGVLPVASTAEAAALTGYEGQYFDVADVDRLQRHTGSAVDNVVKVRQTVTTDLNPSGGIAPANTATLAGSLTIVLPGPAIVHASVQLMGLAAGAALAGYLQIREGATVLNGVSGLGRRFHTQTITTGGIWLTTDAMVNATAGSHTYSVYLVMDAGSASFTFYDTPFDLREIA